MPRPYGAGVTPTAVLAHQGGWDEILFVLSPLVLFAVLLMVARRRVDQLEDEPEGEHDRPEA